MITSEERREIAARLRQFKSDDVSSYSEYLEKLDEIIGINGYGETGERLADLIEPEEFTCRKIRKNDPTHKGNWNFHCSRCNCYLRGTDEYCSNCGARVVE